MGLQPVLVEKVLERARLKHGEEPPAVFADEMALARTALASFWRAPPDIEGPSPPIHAFIGPPGSGKTTVLCKWLAISVLIERCAARVWRLDSRGPNFAGLLDFHAEVLGVRVEREWKGAAGLAGCQRAFIDLPGVDLQDTTAVEQLQAQLVGLEGAQMHLVLNAAYEVPVLLAQARAFDDWPLSDLILTHLDEEKRLGKLWNFLLGTKFTLRFLSGGQNVPGDLSVATPDLLIPQ
jgi:flagellar biosynthesis protein FlhF